MLLVTPHVPESFLPAFPSICPFLDLGEHPRVPPGPQPPASGSGEGRGAVLTGERGRQGEGELGPTGVDPGSRAV